MNEANPSLTRKEILSPSQTLRRSEDGHKRQIHKRHGDTHHPTGHVTQEKQDRKTIF